MILIRLKTFLKSLFWHIYSGCPKSSQDLINDRFNICLNCDMMDSVNNECMVCGCNIGRKKRFLNKLAWADQKCPINKW
jgi:hypothetical protein